MDSTPEILRRPALTSVSAASRSRVLLVGARRDVRRLIRRLGKTPWNGPPIVGFVDAGHSRSSSLRSRIRHFALHSQTDPVPVLGPVDRLDELVDLARATHVVVAVSGDSGRSRSRPHVPQLINSDVVVQWVLVDSARLDLGSLTGSSTATTWSLHSATRPQIHLRLPRWDRLTGSRTLKRIVDSIIAAIALLVLSPLFALVALAILVTTGRPIFYTQERVGQGGLLFRIIKFRSMRCDAESATGPIWASDHDTRCTRIGDWLRHTNIDELPQLLNVVRGEMSLVGPRPERPSFVERFRQTVPDYDLRHAVPVGMTGWAQVHGWRGRTSLRKRVQYDLDYIERWSPGLDLRILLMTVQHVLWGKTSWNETKKVAQDPVLNGQGRGMERTREGLDCSVVIPSYNGRALLLPCLESVARHRPGDLGPSIEVIVADDASTDGTAEWLARVYPEVRVVRLERNGGFCAAANRGIAAARGRFIQLLNNDTVVTNGWVEAGLAPFADPTVGSVAPLVLVRSDPSRVDSAGDSYALAGWPTKRGHGQPGAVFAARLIEDVFGASGSSAFYRSAALRRVGGFDPILGSYYEDIDLAFRLRWAGYRCVFAPRCVIHHDVSATYDHGNPSLQRRMARNAEIVFWANMPRGLLMRALAPHLAFVALQGAWRLARGRLRPFLLGKCDALCAWPEIWARRKLRSELAKKAVATPHFALGSGSIQDVRNHLKRPVEQSSQRQAANTQHVTRVSGP